MLMSIQVIDKRENAAYAQLGLDYSRIFSTLGTVALEEATMKLDSSKGRVDGWQRTRMPIFESAMQKLGNISVGK